MGLLRIDVLEVIELILPVGLDRPLTKVPYGTLIILLVTCYMFSKNSDIDYLYELSQSSKEFQLKEHGVNLFKNLCLETLNEELTCEKYKTLVENKYIEFPNSYTNDDFKDLRKISDFYIHEGEQYDSLLSELENDSTVAEPLKKSLNIFFKDIYTPVNHLSGIKGFDTYNDSLKKYYQQVKKIHHKHNILSKLNLNLRSLLTSQMSHGGYLHLLMNMFVLLVVGSFIEQRVGIFLFMSLYFLGGSFALISQTYMSQNPFLSLIGASGNVYALVGIFWMLFYRHSMIVFIPLPLDKKVKIPVFYVIPCLFIFSDIRGYVDSQNILVPGSNIAYIAHMSGLYLGVIVGFCLKKLQNIPDRFVDQNEYKLWEDLKSTVILKEKVVLANRILRLYPDHLDVKLEVFHELHKFRMDLIKDPDRKLYFQFLAQHVGEVTKYALRNDQINVFLELYDAIPYQRSFCKMFSSMNLDQLLSLANHSFRTKKYILGLRFLEVYLYISPDSKYLNQIFETIKSLVLTINEDQHLKDYIEGYLPQIKSEILLKYMDQHFTFVGIENAS